MSNFIAQGAAVLPAVKSDARVPTGVVTEWKAADSNQFRQALLDVQAAILGLQNAVSFGIFNTYPAIYYATAATVLGTSQVTPINYDTLVYDPFSTVTTGATWSYTCPLSGIYSVSGAFAYSLSANITYDAFLFIYQNGNAIAQSYRNPTSFGAVASVPSGTFALDVYAAQGDKISIRGFTTANVSTNTGTGSVYMNRVCIRRASP